MPLILPKTLPAYAELGRENVFVMHKRRAETQQIRPLRILALNLMPTKIATETQLDVLPCQLFHLRCNLLMLHSEAFSFLSAVNTGIRSIFPA